MFKEKTVFVVGAGASADYKLPIGSGLLAQISKDLSFNSDKSPGGGDTGLHNYLQDNMPDLRRFIGYCREVSQGLHGVNSIDTFLDLHNSQPGIEKAGKLAICYSILKAERQSTLYFDEDRQAQFPGADNRSTWIFTLFRMLTAGLQADRIQEIFDNISFVCFNYDRCIEHVLYHLLKSTCRLSHDEAVALLNNLVIVHPYGSLGPLPFTGSDKSVRFGASLDYIDLAEMAKGIRTYTERVEEEGQLRRIRDPLTNAANIIFLGFGFHNQNIELIQPDRLKEDPPGFAARHRQIYATTHGMSPPDLADIENRLRSWMGGYSDRRSISQLSVYSSDLLSYYSRLLLE